jgi:hypothetical protein
MTLPNSTVVIGTNNTVADTAALNAASAAAIDGGVIHAIGVFKVDGEWTVAGFSNIEVNVSRAEFLQQTRFKRTLLFSGCGNVKVTGENKGTFRGLGGAAGEFGSTAGIYPVQNKLAGSYNSVAAIYAENCGSIIVDGVRCYNHAGGGIGGYGTYDVTVQNCHVEGIGPNWIAKGENGSDFALNFTLNPAVLTDYVARWRFFNNRLFNHAFGIAGLCTKTFVSQGNDMGPFPGQHGHYMIDCNGVLVQGNNIRGCGELGVKLTLERRGPQDFNIPAWAAGVVKGPGDEIKFGGNIWDANAPSKAITAITRASPAVVTSTAHGYTTGTAVYLSDIAGMTSLNGRWFKVGTVFANEFTLQDFTTLANVNTTSYQPYTFGGKASTKFTTGANFAADDALDRWHGSRKNNIEGVVIADNNIEDCLYGLQITVSADVFTYNTSILGGHVADNVIRNSGADAMKIERFRDGKIINNTVDGAAAIGLFSRDSGVEISGNKLLRCAVGLLGQFAWDSEISDNVIEDAGTTPYAGGGLTRHPLLVADCDANAPTDKDSSPVLLVKGNDIRWTDGQGDCQQAEQMYFGASYQVKVFDTTGTSLYPVKVDGTLLDCGRIHFAGFTAGDQQFPAGVRRGNPYRTFYGAVRPNLEAGSTKNYYVNDTCFNSGPASGEPSYWYCTGSGAGAASTWANGPALP